MMTESFAQTVQRLAGAQKGATKGAPAYSRFVNRRIGRYLAAWAYRRGLSPNAVTGISALFTFSALALVVTVAPSWWSATTIALLLVLGYAWDSADGQVARLTGTGSPAGEWLDHMVDATKVVTLPLAVGVGMWRADAVPGWWYVVPLVGAVAASVLFFGMILTEQLRRAQGIRPAPTAAGQRPGLRSLLSLPTDYGVLCWSFVLLAVPSVFAGVYAVLVAITAAYVIAAAVKWFREISAFGSTP